MNNYRQQLEKALENKSIFVLDQKPNGCSDLVITDENYQTIGFVENAVFGFGLTSDAEAEKLVWFYGENIGAQNDITDEEIYNCSDLDFVFPITIDQLYDCMAVSPTQNESDILLTIKGDEPTKIDCCGVEIKFIGKLNDEFIAASENGGYDHYSFFSSDMMIDNESYISLCGFSSKIDENKIIAITDDEVVDLEQAIVSEAISLCHHCGTGHDTDNYYNHDFIITEDCELVCKGCASFEDQLITISNENDITNAKDLTGIETDERYEEIETLFVDSSGFGSTGEAALTLEQAKQIVLSYLENQNNEIFCGLTGVGQFQVYLTLFRKK